MSEQDAQVIRVGVAAYGRISRDPGNDQKGVTRQIQDARNEVARHPSWLMVGEFVDNDLSATTGKVKRPRFEALLAAVRAGHIQVIVCYMTGRLVRNRRERLETYELLATHRVKIVCTGGTDLDLSTPAGRLVANILGETDTYEVEQAGTRVSDSHKQAAEEGRPSGGRPYGYVSDPLAPKHHKQRLMHPEESAVVCGMVYRVMRGDSYRSIVLELNERGIRTQHGGVWTTAALRAVLRNPGIAGQRRYKGKVVGTATWEPIIDPGKWAILITLMDARSRPHGWSNRHVHLLSGIMLCGRCLADGKDIPVVCRNDSKIKKRIYLCPGKLGGGCNRLSRHGDPVDAYVEETVVRMLGEAGVIEDLLMADTPDANEVLKIAQGIEACKARAARIGEQMADDDPDDEILAIARKSALDKIRGELDALRQRQTAMSNATAAAGLLGVEDIAYHWQYVMTLAQKRAVVAALLRVVLLPVGKGRTATTDHILIERR
ncbi:site-specific recombinase, DNA invertase Pin [Frankia torreyi]|uniref:Site-specific recombinase, DNA invertase Pin n=1 Tax=Frankia torreyi TaxID=1856 RepID=A0A0D8BMU8_9ACTN|nr:MULTISPECIES: recombinase family protein [Frankia]KJE25420.1 site-specific recombinase, DNA invertase Pin [Frankia torreyi]KQM04780.1 site-specific recombinase, DNA invertase Pin [Frankia sp. CpI1-P]